MVTASRMLVRLALVATLAATLVACGSGDGWWGSRTGVVPLAKITAGDGGAPELEFGPAMQVIDDAQTARRAWEAHVVDGVLRQRGDPDVQGIYRDLDTVSFDRQLVVVWWSSEATCPSWVTDVTTTDGVIEVTEFEDDAQGCLDVGSPYRMLLAVDRDRLPEPADLPARLTVTSGTSTRNGQAVRYPDAGASDD